MTIPQKRRSIWIMVAGILLLAGGMALHGATMTLAPAPYQVVFDVSGNPIAGSCIWTYVAGTSTAATTYTDKAGAVPNTNPIIANANGQFTAYLAPGSSYKFVYENIPCSSSSHGAVLWTYDNIDGVPASASSVDVTVTAGETLSAGNCAYLSDGSGSKNAGQWYKCDTGNAYSSILPEIGIAIAAITSGTTGTVRLVGEVTGLSALTIGADYYVSTSGAITATAPAARRLIGRADTTTTLTIGIPRLDPIYIEDDFRLSLTNGTCLTTADVTAATQIFLEPCTGNRITLSDSAGNLATYVTSGASVSIGGLGANQMYDVFAFQTAGSVGIETLNWTNDTARATALSRQSGLWLKSTDFSRRYIGSGRTTGSAGQTEDSLTKRFVWNAYNKHPRTLLRQESTATWTYTTATIRQANAAAANQVDVVIGLAETTIDLNLQVGVANTNTGVAVLICLGVDSTTACSSHLHGSAQTLVVNIPQNLFAHYSLMAGAVGKHTFSWNEASAATGTTTWYGTGIYASVNNQSGLMGWIEG